MRITKSLLSRIDDVLDKLPNIELCYVKADKNDRTDITFLAKNLTEEQAIFLKTRLHTYETRYVSMEWPTSETVKIELIDVSI